MRAKTIGVLIRGWRLHCLLCRCLVDALARLAADFGSDRFPRRSPGMKNQVGATRRLASILPHSLTLLIFMYGGRDAGSQQCPVSGSQLPSSSGFLSAASIQPKNDRIFGVIPNYRTVENPQLKIQPLPTKDKFKLGAEDSFDPYAYPVAGLFAAIAQVVGAGLGLFCKALRGLVCRPDR
jgi:hypothetical protein